MLVRTAPLLLALWLLAGCAQPQPASPEPGVELGRAPTTGGVEPAPLVTPSPAAVAAPSPDAGTASASPPTPAETAPRAPATPRPTTAAAPTPGAAPTPVVLLAVADPRGDQGLEGPDWVDLASVEIVEVGSVLRTTLRFAAELPSAPPDGEVPLVSVDVGPDHQLFVEGGGGTWTAYLSTPEGFVPYPGSFELAGRAMVLQVPLATLGSPAGAEVAVLVEWSRERTLLNAVAEDRLDGGPHRFDRTS